MENKRINVIIKRSLKGIEAQAVEAGKTLVGKKYLYSKGIPTDQAFAYGEEFAKLLSQKNIKMISFDRNGSRYHGRVKSFAEGMRKAGIQF